MILGSVMAQVSLTPIRNHHLFSDHFLEKLIEKTPEWGSNEHEIAFDEIKKCYDRESAFLESLNEKQLENRFFNNVFRALGFEFEVNEPTKTHEFPDYALFTDRATLDNARLNKARNKKSIFVDAIAIGEVKQWEIDLDHFGKDEYNRNHNPSLQIWMYLHDTEPKWGILSNGGLWRLYNKKCRRNDYYEIDLPTMIVKNDVEGFKYFYYFFRKDAFIPTKNGDPFLERVLKGSSDYAKGIGDDLQGNVYKAMKKITEGFIEWKSNNLDPGDKPTLNLVQKNTMILLYRFLFLLYAEGKGLLDIDNTCYQENYSFYRLKKEIKEKQDGPIHQQYQPITSTLWARLKDLFRLINSGSESFGYSKSILNVPAYNGGLFDSDQHPELEKWMIGDSYLAQAIDLISRSKHNGGDKEFVDYSNLEIRHLGSIYEGLLEYQLKVTYQDLVVDEDEWITLEKYNSKRKQNKSLDDFNEYDVAARGHVYLATDKDERKSTGSYYTPDYIVDYIVKNTIGPIVEEKWKNAQERNESYVTATLEVNVLDPAMGSGHFLVGATEFLAQKLLEAVQKDLHTGKITDSSEYTNEWALREVVSHCIYGVDLNYLAVELAKVSLWLTTINKEKPLSFLDHRLKHGNSLVGARFTSIGYYPGTEPMDKTQIGLPPSVIPNFITHILNKIGEIESVKENTVADIKNKARIFKEFKELPEYRRSKGIANLHTSIYFGNKIEALKRKNQAGIYQDLVWAIDSNETEWQKQINNEWNRRANELAKEKSYFYWELEFPEIFFENNTLKDNAGWDVVIGNPPYIRAETADKEERAYMMKSPDYKNLFGRFDVSLAFMEKSMYYLLKPNGNFGMIVPRPFLLINYAKILRCSTLTDFKYDSVVDFRDVLVFEDASVYTCIPIISKVKPQNNSTLYAYYGTDKKEIIPLGERRQSIYRSLPECTIRLNINSKDMLIKEKIEKKMPRNN